VDSVKAPPVEGTPNQILDLVVQRGETAAETNTSSSSSSKLRGKWGGVRVNSGGPRPNSGGARANSGGPRPNSGGARPNSGGPRRNAGGPRPGSGRPRKVKELPTVFPPICGARWYIVKARRGYDVFAVAELKKLNFEVFWVRERILPRKKRGKPITEPIERSLFPQHIIVRFDAAADPWRRILDRERCPHVLGVITTGRASERPGPLRPGFNEYLIAELRLTYCRAFSMEEPLLCYVRTNDLPCR
jgi:hypothetical protein